ncbi:hypothetical protein [Rhodohalobacter sp. 614A]|uniref:hypothetical protein n=1 Tax=Rhodohalobacter sp. 614A TaxID=2908649 RepID=UPI001F2315DD|nr:hypothetical protein [Rhodohalobacter sp. 614A]
MMKYRKDHSRESEVCGQTIFFKYRFRTQKLVLFIIFILIQISLEGFILQNHSYAQTPAEAMEEAKQILNDFGGSLGEVNNRIEQTEQRYNQFRECVTGQGDTGRECQQYIDLLYASVGIEAHEAVMDAKMTMEEMLYEFESSGAFQMLGNAKKGFGTAATIVGNAKNVIDFADQFQKYNPEGARGDPTRGLRMIGEAIGEAAGKLPFPMNTIFEEYAKSVEVISGKLVELQGKIETARQGNLGGGFSSYANANIFFENNFEGQDGRSNIDYFDVTSQFSLLGSNVQVFQNFVGTAMDFFVYDQTLGRNRGWIAPPVFQTVYDYFEALPSQFRGEISAGYRAELLVSQAKSNPNTFIEQAKQDYGKLRESEGNHQYQEILEEMELMDLLDSLLSYSENAFVGLWLFSSEKRNEIQRVLDAITNYVYVNGTVFRDTDSGREAAPNEPVVLEVEEGGTGYATTDEEGNYFVLTRGQLNSRFTIQAGSGEEAAHDESRFYQPGFDNLSLILNKVEIEDLFNPVSLTISPSEVTLEIGEMRDFSAIAIFEDESSANVTGMDGINWTPASSFTATEAGEFQVSVTYMGFEASASITVEEEETVCNEPSEILDKETGSCACNTEEGYELSDSGKCVNIDEAIDELTETGDELCDEEALAASLARLDELVATGNQMAAGFRANLNKFMKEVNDQNSNPCENNIIAAAYAGAKESLAQYELLVDEATGLGTDLILEAGICPLEEISLDINSILQKISQLGPPLNDIRDGLVMMENQLQTFGCDEQEVADQGDTIAERDDPEITQAGGTGATETCGDGIDNDGDGLIDEGCESAGNFNVIIVLYDSGSAADDIFGLSVSGQGNLGTTPEGGSRTYPLRLSPGSYIATVTVISAPDDTGTYTIRILEGDQQVGGRTGGPEQGSVIDVPFTIGGNTEASAETESILPRMMNFMRQIDQGEGGN